MKVTETPTRSLCRLMRIARALGVGLRWIVTVFATATGIVTGSICFADLEAPFARNGPGPDTRPRSVAVPLPRLAANLPKLNRTGSLLPPRVENPPGGEVAIDTAS